MTTSLGFLFQNNMTIFELLQTIKIEHTSQISEEC